MRIQLAQRTEADDLLGRSPLALLIGMLLDQQIPMEWAFTGPYTIAQRLGHDLTAEEIASYDPEAFAALLAEKPAVHRYPSSMAARVQSLAAYLAEQYGGDPERIWAEAADGKELLKRLQALPGYGKQKAQIFLALLGKQLGVRPPGWREAAGPYGEEGSFRSVADVVDADTLGRVRAAKQEAKQEAKGSARAK
ncbi:MULTISPECIES: HhH-GPD-type base excision DNA repair protein [unclassified Nonomuraea]|uniref:HhH-GPD-type base excision DNA repair protein n=1 Tax=unclassified Nonomuraea TaxID=2593643 RepID=UPI0033D69C79